MARTQIKTETIVIDKGANRILAERDKLHKSFAKIGVQGSEASKKHKKGGSINLVKLATVHEFGATINHPGGTPYIIVEGGKAVFVKKGTKGVVGVTKAHKITIPQRSFIRSTMDKKRAEFRQMGDKLVDSLLAQQLSAKGLLARMGIVIETAIKNTITTLKTPVLKAATIRRKKSSNPLVDTGQLRASITSRPVMKGK